MFDAFAESKNRYVERCGPGRSRSRPTIDEMHQRVMEITGGDPLPYGIEPNRKVLEELVGHAVAQKIIAPAGLGRRLVRTERPAVVA